MKTEADIYEEIAEIMAKTIEKNNEKGKRTVIICPVGPIGQYPIFAQKVNARKISLKNSCFINMDEYLDENGQSIAYENRLSFSATMDRVLYSQIEPSLLMDQSQRLFPLPGHEEEIDALIDSFEKVDLCLTGVGINGHIAFNEPPAESDPIKDSEFKDIGTRCADIARETIVNNGANKMYGALDIFPRLCITLGMRQLLKAEVLKVYLYCPWQWGIMRKIALEEESRLAPASFLQSHKNAEMVITEQLYNMSL